MPNLTGKELSALEDQLGFEHVLYCKYKTAAQQATDTELTSKFEQCAKQHQQNYTSLMTHLK